MKILSLFDGISVAHLALDRAGIPVEKYYASEIDEYAMAISRKNYPGIIQIGDVTNVPDLSGIDLLIGGSPCQDLSGARGKRDGLQGSRSALFWNFLEILQRIKPKYFILENTANMSPKDKQIISDSLLTEPLMINAALVSAQDRKRYFWTNIPSVGFPENRHLTVRDILQIDRQRKFLDLGKVVPIKTRSGLKWDISGKGYFSQQHRAYSINGKFPTIPASRTITKINILFDDGGIGLLHWEEVERLQCLPDGYTDLGTGNRIEKRGKAIGNAFNADVITHILKQIPQ